MTSNREEIITRYDGIVYESRESGLIYQDVIENIADDMSARFHGTSVSGLNVPELIYDSVRFHVQTMRSGRRQSLKDLFNDLGDKMDHAPGTKQHDKAQARLEMNIGRSFPLGAEDGSDKCLGMWTVDDVRNSIASRADNLMKQRAAFGQFDIAAQRAIRAITKGVEWA